MAYFFSRTPKNYDDTKVTSRHMKDVLSNVLAKISEVNDQRPDLILAMWPEIIGQKLAPMTKAVSFIEGVLLVKVKNSTLHSLLSQNERPRLLSLLRKKFPNVEIRNICFKIG